MIVEVSRATVIRVDPATGEQAVIADVQGAFKIGSEADGHILVMDVSGLLRIDPATGARERVPNAGGLFAVVPAGVGPPAVIPLPPAAWSAGPLVAAALAFRTLRAPWRRAPRRRVGAVV